MFMEKTLNETRMTSNEGAVRNEGIRIMFGNNEARSKENQKDDVLSLLDSISPDPNHKNPIHPSLFSPKSNENAAQLQRHRVASSLLDLYADESLQSLLFDSEEDSLNQKDSDRKRAEYLCSRCRQPKKGHVCPVPLSPSEKEERREKRKRKKEETLKDHIAVQSMQTTKFLRLEEPPMPAGPPQEVSPFPSGEIGGISPSSFGITSLEPRLKAPITPSSRLTSLSSGKEESSLIFPESPPGPFCRWIGFPLRYVNGVVHYDTLEYQGNSYRLGDCAYFFSTEGDLPYVGKIVGMWQREDTHDTREMFVNVLWFYRSQNLQLEIPSHPKELYLGKVIDPNCVHSIRGKCQVILMNDFLAQPQPEDTFFCQFHYDEFKLYPLKHKGGHTTIPNATMNIDDSKLSSPLVVSGSLEIEEREKTRKRGRPPSRRTTIHNWPTELHYLRKTKGYGDLPLNVKIGLYTQAENYRGNFEILKIEDESHPSRGQYGVFAKRDLKKHRILGEYTGEVKMGNLSDKRKEHVGILYRGTKISVQVDASQAGNEFRFLNDYRGTGKTRPNVELHSAPLNGEWHIFVVSIKAIPKGTELLVDYSSACWEAGKA